LGKIRSLEEWLLLSPTGVPLLRLVGKDDILQLARPNRDPQKFLQGVTSLVIDERKAARLRKRK